MCFVMPTWSLNWTAAGESDHRFNLPAVYWSNLADGMCVNKSNATALSIIVKIEVDGLPHIRVSKALVLN